VTELNPPPGTALLAHPGAELYGSDRVLLESVSALIEGGWRVVVAVPNGGPLLAELRARGAEVARCTTPVLRRNMLRPKGMMRFLGDAVVGLISGLRLLALEKPRVIYINTVTIPLWQLLARLRGTPVLCHVHEGEASANRLLRWIIALPLLLSTAIVANSNFSKNVITGSFPSLERRVTVIYNGIPGPLDPTPPRARLTGPVHITYVGRLSHRKGVDVAIDAVALLTDRGVAAQLDIVGATFPGYEWYERELREQVKQKRLDGLVCFHGFQASIWDIVARGDVVVVPSRVDEPFGDTAVEAILSGRPVVASATSGLLEATAGYRAATTVTPGSPQALADGLQTQIENWGAVPEALQSDHAVARRRHGPQVYRERIARSVATIATAHH
jgi:glycosyltransferase involved in cell wall biosynthesis